MGNVWRLQTKTDSKDGKKISTYCKEESIAAVGWSINDDQIKEYNAEAFDKIQLSSQYHSLEFQYAVFRLYMFLNSFYCPILSLTSISVGIAGIAPFFSTHRLATAFPNRTYSFNSFNVDSSGFFPDLLIRYKNPPQKESPAPFVSATLLTNPGICRPPSLQ